MIEITQVHASLDEAGDEAACLAIGRRAVKRALRCEDSQIKAIELHRKSIDARKKRDVHFILSFRVELTSSRLEQEVVERVAERDRSRIRMVDGEAPSFPNPVPNAPKGRPVVVGAGCAGLFAALTLAEAGLKPLLIERGDPALRRSEAIDLFLKERILDPESNIQFGLGGAGTFSDGKLNTGTKNPAHRLILETFVEAGSPRDILWDAKPHIGSDILPTVVTNISQRIERLGGTVRYRTKLVDIRTDGSGAITGIDVQPPQETTSETIATKHLILACGHSARDVFELLKEHNVALAQKTFAMGVRIEHPQALIDSIQYHCRTRGEYLPAASYSLVSQENGRGVYSFCMCPGGFVVPAASGPEQIVVNGMSPSNRGSVWANSGMVVELQPEDFGARFSMFGVLAGIKFQEDLERQCYLNGNCKQTAPAQRMTDFVNRRNSFDLPRSSYSPGLIASPLHFWLPDFIAARLQEGFKYFGKVSHGFLTREAVMIGVETRTSSPVRIPRDRESMTHIRLRGFYPCGEGAGYAGGIVSAAIDGERCAEALAMQIKQSSSFDRSV